MNEWIEWTLNECGSDTHCLQANTSSYLTMSYVLALPMSQNKMWLLYFTWTSYLSSFEEPPLVKTLTGGVWCSDVTLKQNQSNYESSSLWVKMAAMLIASWLCSILRMKIRCLWNATWHAIEDDCSREPVERWLKRLALKSQLLSLNLMPFSYLIRTKGSTAGSLSGKTFLLSTSPLAFARVPLNHFNYDSRGASASKKNVGLVQSWVKRDNPPPLSSSSSPEGS